MEPIAYLKLEPSETAVLHVASRIYAAQIAVHGGDQGKEEELMQRSILQAIKMARVVEALVQSDQEKG